MCRGSEPAVLGMHLARGMSGVGAMVRFEGAPRWAQAGPGQVREGSRRTEESLRPREIGVVDRAEELVKPGQLEHTLHGPWPAHDHKAPPAPPRSLVSLRQHA